MRLHGTCAESTQSKMIGTRNWVAQLAGGLEDFHLIPVQFILVPRSLLPSLEAKYFRNICTSTDSIRQFKVQGKNIRRTNGWSAVRERVLG